MGRVHDAIREVRAEHASKPRDAAREEGRLRAAALAALDLSAGTSWSSPPFTITLLDSIEVVAKGGGHTVRINLEVRRGGRVLPLDMPWYVSNPLYLTADPQGKVELDGRRYREDLLAALRDMAADLVSDVGLRR